MFKSLGKSCVSYKLVDSINVLTDNTNTTLQFEDCKHFFGTILKGKQPSWYLETTTIQAFLDKISTYAFKNWKDRCVYRGLDVHKDIVSSNTGFQLCSMLWLHLHLNGVSVKK